MEYPPELHERDDDYLMYLEVMTIKPEITGNKQQNLRAQYFWRRLPVQPETYQLLCFLQISTWYLASNSASTSTAE